MATEKSIAEALEYSLTVAENTFLTAFYNKVKELVEHPEVIKDEKTGEVKFTINTIDIAKLEPLVDFVKECYKNVSM